MRTLKLVFKGVLLVLMLTGCTLGSKEAETMATVEPGSGTLRIWIAGENRPIDTFNKFTEATGIKIQAEFAPQQEWQQKLLANKGNPGADLFWSDNTIDLAVLSGLGLFETYESPFAVTLPDYARDSEGRWHGLTERKLALVYSAAAVTDEVPTTVEQLSQPKWQGRIVAPPASSRLWARFLADVAAFEGEEELEQWLHRLGKLDFHISDNPTIDVQKVVDGTAPALLTTSETALQVMLENEQQASELRIQSLASKHAKELDIVTGIAILRGSEEQQAAQTLVDFLLKEENRRHLASDRTHDVLLTKEEYNNNEATRLHPDEIALLLPLIEYYWNMSFAEPS